MPESPESIGNTIQQAHAIGQSIWFDYISRNLIDSGELKRLVESGVRGVTSNPAIFQSAISGSGDYDASLVSYGAGGSDDASVFELIAIDDVRDAADVLRPVYDGSNRSDGFVSIEVNPLLADRTDETIAEARRLYASIDRPNVMIKVPGTPEGVPAVRKLISEGISVNVTLLFSLSAYRTAARAYVDGLADYVEAGGDDLGGISSVASFFVSRVDTSADGALAEVNGGDEIVGKIGIANARLAYAEFRELISTAQWQELAVRGALPQRPLWASTGVKNPDYSDVLYMNELMGADTVNTAPPATLDAFLDHGEVSERVTVGVDDARAQIARLEELGISLDGITDELLTAGVKTFADAFEGLLGVIATRRSELSGASASSD
ncbi:MAG: transaldolase [Chloroflexi bacterium]|jgi:transaldolase / glucose-6-phosphate isomerase|nr:transaldolase [Chloroflexota bacterium]MBT4074715.1 transaldolase [Chloroflexota bacterium]MBT6682092.1 transaldolase [Chloroflexota bacterium]